MRLGKPSWLAVIGGTGLTVMALKDARDFHDPELVWAAGFLAIFTLGITLYLMGYRLPKP